MSLQHSDPRVLRKSLCPIVDAATTLHLVLFQMATPLYISGLLLRVIWIGVKACINVTLYDELFITSINEKHFLSPLYVPQDNFDHCPVIYSWITIVPPCQTHGKWHTTRLVHSMAYFIEPMTEA